MSQVSPDLRGQAEKCFTAGDAAQALQALRALWRAQPTSSTAGYLLAQRQRLQALPGRRPWRLAVLRSFTVEPVLPLLDAAAMLEGIDLALYVSEFNAYSQEILDPASALYAFEPDAVILAVQARDIAPELWDRSAGLQGEERAAVVAQVLAQYRSLLETFRQRSQARVIVHNFERPAPASAGIFDAQEAGGQADAIGSWNRGLRELAATFQGVYVLDYDALVARHGSANWHDPVKWLTARLPIAAPCLKHLAREWFRFVYAMAGTVRKVLVTDLDNTLWGGLAGEGGLEGIVLNQEYPGAGYRNLQRAMLDLSERGILLAITSKNNETDALPILEQHAEMLLRPAHFAAMRINWQDKAQNLREIALELNLGVDSLVFVDDNPAERELIRRELPEVDVIELPENPMQYEAALRESVMFERLTLTAEDKQRVRQYQQQRERSVAAQATGSIEDYYRSLQQKVTIRALAADTLGRIAQLTQKTNQFNMTTRRYSEEQIASMAAGGHLVYSVQVEDRFGDNGIVGVVIAQESGQVYEIDTFLLSCRVIGRTVETAILAFLASDALQRGKQEVRGGFQPTKKNLPAERVYALHGFFKVEQPPETPGSLWALPTTPDSIRCPEWIEVQVFKGKESGSYAVQ